MKKNKVKKASERRKGRDRRRKGAIDLIFSRMVARNVFPERRRGDRRGI